jgi:hypothetical protein
VSRSRALIRTVIYPIYESHGRSLQFLDFHAVFLDFTFIIFTYLHISYRIKSRLYRSPPFMAITSGRVSHIEDFPTTPTLLGRVRDRAVSRAGASPTREVGPERKQPERQHRLSVAMRRVRSVTSRRSWGCFEWRLFGDWPAAVIAAQLGITANAVFVHASRVLKAVWTECAAPADEMG